jgi:hypothetical protein
MAAGGSARSEAVNSDGRSWPTRPARSSSSRTAERPARAFCSPARVVAHAASADRRQCRQKFGGRDRIADDSSASRPRPARSNRSLHSKHVHLTAPVSCGQHLTELTIQFSDATGSGRDLNYC